MACETAMWWRTRPSLREFLTFPSPMNEAEVRPKNIINAALAILHVALDYYYGFPGVAIFIIYGFVARTLAGPRLCPTALLVLFVLRPLLVRFHLLKDNFVPAPPKRFAQAMGLLCTLLAFMLRVLLPPQQAWVSYAVWGAFVVVASIAGFADFCIACWVFDVMVAHRLVSARVCEECAVNYMSARSLLRADPAAPTKQNKSSQPAGVSVSPFVAGSAPTATRPPPGGGHDVV